LAKEFMYTINMVMYIINYIPSKKTKWESSLKNMAFGSFLKSSLGLKLNSS